MSDCPRCGKAGRKAEILHEANHGGGYRVKCHGCGQEWDDKNASHGERETTRRAGQRVEARNTDLAAENELLRGILRKAYTAGIDVAYIGDRAEMFGRIEDVDLTDEEAALFDDITSETAS